MSLINLFKLMYYNIYPTSEVELWLYDMVFCLFSETMRTHLLIKGCQSALQYHHTTHTSFGKKVRLYEAMIHKEL